MSRIRLIKRLQILVAGVLVVALSGCSDDEPNNPVSEQATLKEKIRIDNNGDAYIPDYEYPSLEDFEKYAGWKTWIFDADNLQSGGAVMKNGSVDNTVPPQYFEDIQYHTDNAYFIRQYTDIASVIRSDGTNGNYFPETGWLYIDGEKHLRVLEIDADHMTCLIRMKGLEQRKNCSGYYLYTYTAWQDFDYDYADDKLSRCAFDIKGFPFAPGTAAYMTAEDFATEVVGKSWTQHYSQDVLPGAVFMDGRMVYRWDYYPNSRKFMNYEFVDANKVKVSASNLSFTDATYEYTYNPTTGMVEIPGAGISFRVSSVKRNLMRIFIKLEDAGALGYGLSGYYMQALKS